MAKIAHISDVHIRGSNFLDEMEFVFEKLYESLREQKVDLIVIAGDTYHSKLTVTNEYFDLASRFFRALAEIADVIIIRGNHDLALNNISRLDALTPVINAVKEINTKYKIYYSTVSEKVYTTGDNVRFYSFSISDPKTKWPKKSWLLEDDPAGDKYVNVALYHGTINGCVYENEQVVTGHKDNLSLFDGFDYAMLGDIHKRQFLTDKIAYAGSLRQNNYGEDLQKGYLLWDIKGKNHFDCEFIELEQKRYFITINVQSDDVPEDLGIPKDCRIRVISHSNLKLEQEIKLKNKVKRLYKPCNDVPVSTPRNSIDFSNIKIGNDLILKDNIRKQEIQAKLIQNYLKQLETTDSVIKKVIELDKTYHSYIDSDALRNIVWDIKKFEWSNLFSYGEGNSINFQNLKGIIGLFGPNMTGKSSVIDSLSYCMFNSINKAGAIKNATYVNTNKTAANAKASIKISNNEYVISRTTTKKKTKNGNELCENEIDFKVKSDKTISLNEETTPDTNKRIRKIFGTKEDFNLISVAAQWSLSQFIDTRDTDRKKILGKFIDLEIFETKYDLALEDFKAIKKSVEEYEKTDLVQLEQKHSKNVEKINEKLQFLSQKLSEIDDKIAEIDSDLAINKSRIQNVNQVYNENDERRLNDKISLIKKNIEKLENSLFVEDKKIIELYNTGLKYEEDDSDRILLPALVERLNKIRDNKKKLPLLEKIPCGNSYPSCMFIKDAMVAKDDLNKEVLSETELQEQIKQIQTKIENNKRFVEYEDALIRKQNLASSLDFEKESLQRHVQLLNDCLANKNVDNEKILKTIESLESFKKELKNQYTAVFHQINTSHVALGSEEKDLKLVKEKISKSKSLYEKYNLYELYLKCMGKNGISYWILSQKLPVINMEVNNILKEVVDFRLEIVDNEEDKKIEISIIDERGSKKDVELGSGAEKTLSSLALMACMWSICCLPKCSTLFLDEPFVYLDDENKDKVLSLLNVLKNYYKNIIIITHSQELKVCADYIINVERNEEGYAECKS